MMAIATLAIVSVFNGIVEDTCDLIELNHYHDQQGNLVFDQVIFWGWNEETHTFAVRDWTMMNDVSGLWTTTTRCSLTYKDACNKCERRVNSKYFRESWTNHDPEREDLKIVPYNQRVRLSK